MVATEVSSCQDPAWVGGRLVQALSIMMLFSSMSIHLGSKSSRNRIPNHVKHGLFQLAQCSVLAIVAFEDISPSLAAFVAGAFTQQFGTEPYSHMGLLALQKLFGNSSNSSSLSSSPSKPQKVSGSSSSFQVNDGLKILLMVGVAIHHYCIIVVPLFVPCVSRAGQEILPFFLGGIVALGCIAGISKSNMVRAGTDLAAIGLYWTWLAMSTDELGTFHTIAMIWVILATIGDILIGIQLLLWQLLVHNKVSTTAKEIESKIMDTSSTEEYDVDLEDPICEETAVDDLTEC